MPSLNEPISEVVASHAQVKCQQRVPFNGSFIPNAESGLIKFGALGVNLIDSPLTHIWKFSCPESFLSILRYFTGKGVTKFNVISTGMIRSVVCWVAVGLTRVDRCL